MVQINYSHYGKVSTPSILIMYMRTGCGYRQSTIPAGTGQRSWDARLERSESAADSYCRHDRLALRQRCRRVLCRRRRGDRAAPRANAALLRRGRDGPMPGSCCQRQRGPPPARAPPGPARRSLSRKIVEALLPPHRPSRGGDATLRVPTTTALSPFPLISPSPL